ncbi:hypothetical protein KC349_g325 [Hortaea werneckii]|nr:hypothetical protein KC349_g325 [Hortaea werneckii]
MDEVTPTATATIPTWTADIDALMASILANPEGEQINPDSPTSWPLLAASSSSTPNKSTSPSSPPTSPSSTSPAEKATEPPPTQEQEQQQQQQDEEEEEEACMICWTPPNPSTPLLQLPCTHLAFPQQTNPKPPPLTPVPSATNPSPSTPSSRRFSGSRKRGWRYIPSPPSSTSSQSSTGSVVRSTGRVSGRSRFSAYRFSCRVRGLRGAEGERTMEGKGKIPSFQTSVANLVIVGTGERVSCSKGKRKKKWMLEGRKRGRKGGRKDD